MHRFENGPVAVRGRLFWDHLRLWANIKQGLAAYAARYDAPLAGIGLDTWGVDYGLLDGNGMLMGNPFHYRDAGTDGMAEAAHPMERAFAIVPKADIYAATGIQFMPINTLYQLLARKLAADPQLALAKTLLMTPDLFHYWLTGRIAASYGIASTSQMLDARQRTWATDLLARFDLPVGILPPIVQPGTVLGSLLPDVAAETGLPAATPVIVTGAHDTADAVAAVPDLDQRSAYISSGTWSLMGVETTQPVITELSLAFDFTNEGGVGGTIRLLKNVAGLWLLQESRRQWQRQEQEYSWEQLISLAQEAAPLRSIIDPDAPEFASPGDMPATIRAYCQRTGEPVPDSAGAVARCILESLALKYRWVLEKLETLVGHRLDTIRIVGGARKTTCSTSSPPMPASAPSSPAPSRPRPWAT